MPLRLRLSVSFVLVVLAPLIVGLVLVGRGVPAALDRQIGARLGAESVSAAALLSSLCDRASVAARALALEAATQNPSLGVADALTHAGADYAAVLDAGGQVVASAGQLPAAAGPHAAAASCHGSGSPYVIAESAPVSGGVNQQVRRVEVAYAVDGTLAASLRPSADQKVGIVLASGGRVIAASVPDGVNPAAVARVSTRQLPASGAVHADSRLVAGTPPGPGHPVAVLTVASAQGHGGVVFWVILGAVIVVLLAALIGYQLARSMTRSLSELADAADRISSGELDTAVPHSGDDEVGRLGAAFAEMTDELRQTIRALEASRDQLRHNIARLGETLSSTHDLNRMLAVILETAMATVGAEGGAILLSSAGRNDLALRVGRGLEGRSTTSSARIRVGDGVTGMVAATGEPVMGRVGTGTKALHLSPDEPRAESLIAVPLKSSGQVIGVLDLYDRVDGADFDDGDLATIRTFAAQATVAIDNVLLHQEAQRLSITDGLTGLWNFRYFQMQFGKEIERATRFGRPLGLLMVDIDRFKDVNDTYGHQRGDTVLVELAQRVKAEIREVDTVARYGGEELVLILPETDLEGAIHVAQRICDAVRHRPFGDSVTPDEPPLPITVSVGVAVFPQHGSTPAGVLRAADDALYVAKRSGRDQWSAAPDDVASEH